MRLRPHGAAAVLGFLAWLGPGVAYAQAEPLTSGREVRVFARGVAGSFDGILVSVTPNAITLRQRDGSIFTLQATQIQRAEVLGSRTNARRGGVIGGALGLAAGVGLAISSRGDCRDSGGFCDDPGDHFNEWHLVVPAVAGAAAGALVGHFLHSPRWVPGVFVGATTAGGADFGFAWSLQVGRDRGTHGS
ncbi:MAG: hypothetical protein ABL963_08550 [Longimicrobiales bacterium]